MTMRTRFRTLAAALALTLAFMFAPAFATDYTLSPNITTASKSWNDISIWTGGPGGGDNKDFPWQEADTAALNVNAKLTLNGSELNTLLEGNDMLKPGVVTVGNNANVTLTLSGNAKPTFGNLLVEKGSFILLGQGAFCTKEISVDEDGTLALNHTDSFANPESTSAINIINNGRLSIDGPTLDSSLEVANSGTLVLGTLQGTPNLTIDTKDNSSTLTFSKSFDGNITLNLNSDSTIVLQNIPSEVKSISIKGNNKALSFKGAGYLNAAAESTDITLNGGLANDTFLTLDKANDSKVTVGKYAKLIVPGASSNTSSTLISDTNVTVLSGGAIGTTMWGAFLTKGNLTFSATDSMLEITGTPYDRPVLRVNGTLSAPEGLTVTLNYDTDSKLGTAERAILSADKLDISDTVLDKITVKNAEDGDYTFRISDNALWLTRAPKDEAEVESNYDKINGKLEDSVILGKRLVRFASKPLYALKLTVSGWKHGGTSVSVDTNTVAASMKRGGLTENIKPQIVNVGDTSVTFEIPVISMDEHDAFEVCFTGKATAGADLLTYTWYPVQIGNGAMYGTLTASANGSTDKTEITVSSGANVAFKILWKDTFVKSTPETTLTSSNNGPSGSIPTGKSTCELKFDKVGTYTITAAAKDSYSGHIGTANTVTVHVQEASKGGGGGGGGCNSGMLSLALLTLAFLKFRKA